MKNLLAAALIAACGIASAQTASYTVSNATQMSGATVGDPDIPTIRNVRGVGTDFNSDTTVHGYIIATTGFTVSSGHPISHPYQKLYAVQWNIDGTGRSVIDWCWYTSKALGWTVKVYNPDNNPACSFPAQASNQIVINAVQPIGDLPSAGLYYYNLQEVSPDGAHLLGTINGLPFVVTVVQ
jgi:hypothetical protein